MSLGSLMKDSVQVWERTTESDNWVQQGTALRAFITEKDASVGRTESRWLVPDGTHTGYIELSDELAPGRRLRRPSDNAEWTIDKVYPHDRPPPGHAEVVLSEMEATTQG